MGWRGIAIGGYVGSLFGGPLGAILGAALGHTVEKRMSGGDKSPRDSASFQCVPPRQRSQIFCASAAAMFAKMAKADGRITRDEIDCVENAFRRLGFSPAARNHAVDAFRRAKNDEHTIYEYAEEFAAVVDSVDVRPRGIPSSPRVRAARRLPAIRWLTHTRCWARSQRMTRTSLRGSTASLRRETILTPCARRGCPRR